MRILKILATVILSVFAPIKSILITTLVLIICDFILGIMAAIKRKESITSAEMRRTVTKIFVYEIAVMLGFLAEVYLIGESVPVSRIVAGFIGLTEFQSIMENLDEISGTHLLSALITKLGSKNLESTDDK